MTDPTRLRELLERLKLLAAWRKPGGKTPTEPQPNTHKVATQAADAIEALLTEREADKARIAALEGALETVWKEATTMRNASKLVGPYPTEQAKNRIWARSMYHAGKRIMEMLKPARATLENRNG